MDISEPAAIRDLASIIGEGNLKVATYFVKDTTFHAKGWRFHESQPSFPSPDGGPGYSHAIIGSSNMSYPALNVGVEWNVRISDADLGRDVLATFDDTFERYWKDEHPHMMVEDFKDVQFDLLEAIHKDEEETQIKCSCDHCKQVKGNAMAAIEKVQEKKFLMRQQNKARWEARRAHATQVSADQSLMIMPTPEVDMEDAPSEHSNTPPVGQQHNLHISDPSRSSSPSAKRPLQYDHKSASQSTTRRNLVSSQASQISGPPPFDADESILSEVEQNVQSTYIRLSNISDGLADEWTSFIKQTNSSTPRDIIKTTARIKIGTELLQKIPLGHTGAAENSRIAQLSRFVSGQVWRAMSLKQDPILRHTLTEVFVTQTMREAMTLLRNRVHQFRNLH